MSDREEKTRIARDLGGRLYDSGDGCTLSGDNRNIITLDASAQRYAAEQWKAANPDAWAYIVRLALIEVKNERRFNMQRLIEEVRRKALLNAEGGPFGVNNTLRPALTRLLILEYPETRPFLETRRSACDWAFQEPA